ncbi:MAG: EutN/CcmL family microcompartment protein [Pirellulales bacterium]|nr:EutN/CcmL family microcompartment protein [Pirellulales bacterium]
MQLATVIGHATATLKHPSMHGWKLLLVQPFMKDGQTPDGDVLLAVDHLGAGRGERVIITSDGAGTRALMKSDTTPVRWSVTGIADQASGEN